MTVCEGDTDCRCKPYTTGALFGYELANRCVVDLDFDALSHAKFCDTGIMSHVEQNQCFLKRKGQYAVSAHTVQGNTSGKESPPAVLFALGGQPRYG